MKHIFIVNPAAGKQGSEQEVVSHIGKLKGTMDYDIYTTTRPLDATRYVRWWCGEHPDTDVRFYACGGDGTLNEVAAGVVGFPRASISCYAVGSGNDFVKYYGGRERFLDIESLVNGKDIPVDIMKVGDRYCFNVFNFGFDTCVARTMSQVKNKRGFSGTNAYTAGVVKALLTAMRTECSVTVDGELIHRGTMLLCTISNGTFVGGSYNCAPRSKNDDGLLEVCLVKPISRLKFFSMINPYKQGKHLDDPRFAATMVYRRGKIIEVEGPEGFAVTLDGEIVADTFFRIETLKQAVRFAVPDNRDGS